MVAGFRARQLCTQPGQAERAHLRARLPPHPSTPTLLLPFLFDLQGVWISYIVVIIAYFGTAICGYAAFGATVSSGGARAALCKSVGLPGSRRYLARSGLLQLLPCVAPEIATELHTVLQTCC